VTYTEEEKRVLDSLDGNDVKLMSEEEITKLNQELGL
jgi:hypothetical protein